VIGPGAGLAAFRWAVFIAVLAGLLLLAVEPGSAEFVITAFMLGVSVVFAVVIAVLVRLKNR
jgi:hypothetical protein